jgi:hypothetical protein
MEDGNKLEHLRTSLDQLETISKEFSSRVESADGLAPDLAVASDLLNEFRNVLSGKYEQLNESSGPQGLSSEANAGNVGYSTNADEVR